mgnify:CR=1 FL=1
MVFSIGLMKLFLSYCRTVTTPDDEKIPLTDKFLRDLIINFMIAGRDTTACMLSWFFYELSQNPVRSLHV